MTAVVAPAHRVPAPPTPAAQTPAPPTSARPTTALPARVLRVLVRAYQLLRAGRPSPCRYVPSCSEYSMEALERHGAVRGSWLTVRRLLRCHPWGGWGADPVPD